MATLFDEETKNQHLKLLAAAWAETLFFDGSYGYGVWSSCGKRPFGSSVDFEASILDILGIAQSNTQTDMMTLIERMLGTYTQKHLARTL